MQPHATRSGSQPLGSSQRRPTHTLRTIQTSVAETARGRSDDSWVEVSSQPSSSSLSSIADDIITTGLRVQHGSNAKRRRRHSDSPLQVADIRGRSAHTTTSSQEEYEETDSDSDKIMTSSNEGLRPSPAPQMSAHHARHIYSSASSDGEGEDNHGQGHEDEDENATAVGYNNLARNQQFAPQPNVFSHPRPQAARAASTTASLPPSHYTPRPQPRSMSQRNSYSSQPTPQSWQQPVSAFPPITPSHHLDHEAALRASLSTLLSCAAAARALPKTAQTTQTAARAHAARLEPTSFRMVPESVALGPSSSAAAPPPPRPSQANPRARNSAATRSPIVTGDPSTEKLKRKAPAHTVVARSSSKDRKAVKKVKSTTSMEDISPTLLTWVVSAGVVVLVSAISFSAGYVVGRESGRVEVIGQLSSAGTEGRRCAKEVANEVGRAGLGLRRFRWTEVGNAAASVRA